jgi:hypothetical protein
MKPKILLIVVVGCCLIGTSAYCDDSKKYDLKGVTKITIVGVNEVSFEESKNSVAFLSYDRILEKYLKAEISNGEFKLVFDKLPGSINRNLDLETIRAKSKLKLILPLSLLTSVNLSRVSEVEFENRLPSTQLYLTLDKCDKVSGNLNYRSLIIHSSYTGKLELSGSIASLDLTVFGTSALISNLVVDQLNLFSKTSLVETKSKKIVVTGNRDSQLKYYGTPDIAFKPKDISDMSGGIYKKI